MCLQIRRSIDSDVDNAHAIHFQIRTDGRPQERCIINPRHPSTGGPTEGDNVALLGRQKVTLKGMCIVRNGEVVEDPATAIVHHNQGHPNPQTDGSDKPTHVMQEGEVAQKHRRGSITPRQRLTRSRGYRAVNSIGASIGQHPKTSVQRGRKPIQIADGHATRHMQCAAFGQGV
jgi:hypothetical protein